MKYLWNNQTLRKVYFLVENIDYDSILLACKANVQPLTLIPLFKLQMSFATLVHVAPYVVVENFEISTSILSEWSSTFDIHDNLYS